MRGTGEQHSSARQDLINHLGRFLGFEVTFGRYQGVVGKIGFDGLWASRTGFNLVVEVKTAEIHAVKTATILNYINDLVSQKATIDPVVDLMSRIVAGRKSGEGPPEPVKEMAAPRAPAAEPMTKSETIYWLTPAKTIGDETAEDCIKKLVGTHLRFR